MCWQKWPCRPWFNQWWHQRRGLGDCPSPPAQAQKWGSPFLVFLDRTKGHQQQKSFAPPPPLSKLFTSTLLSVSGFAEKIKAEARVPLSPSLIIFDWLCRNIYSLSYMYTYKWFCYKELWWVLGLILWKIIPVLNQWENEPKIENAWAFMKPDSHRLQNSVLQYTKIKM